MGREEKCLKGMIWDKTGWEGKKSDWNPNFCPNDETIREDKSFDQV